MLIGVSGGRGGEPPQGPGPPPGPGPRRARVHRPQEDRVTLLGACKQMFHSKREVSHKHVLQTRVKLYTRACKNIWCFDGEV